MSLNKKLDKMFEADFKKIEEEEIDEANTTVDAGGEYNTKYAFGKKKKKDLEKGCRRIYIYENGKAYIDERGQL